MSDTQIIPTLRIIDQFGNEGRELLALPYAEYKVTTLPPFTHSSDRQTYRHADRYAEWRRTKCRPVDRHSLQDNLRDLDQATHEFGGEVAELADIVITHGGACFVHGDARRKLIDEAGDVFFCGSWAGDAWGRNPLLRLPDGDVEKVLEPAVQFKWDMLRVAAVRGFSLGRYDAGLWEGVYSLTIRAMVAAGLLCNMYKKLRYQQRPQDPDVASEHIRAVLGWANALAILADSTVQDCLASNIAKLDHRYPEGYRPGSGGGNRTGVGA